MAKSYTVDAVLDRAAEQAYIRLLDHAGLCRPCEREGDGGKRERMCRTGRSLLAMWERAEELAADAAPKST